MSSSCPGDSYSLVNSSTGAFHGKLGMVARTGQGLSKRVCGGREQNLPGLEANMLTFSRTEDESPN